MTTVQHFRKRPVTVSAMQWLGTNADDLIEFTDGKFRTAPCPIGPGQDAEVFDQLHNTWIGVNPRDWIVRGVLGEFYPCREDVFAETYEAAGEPIQSLGLSVRVANGLIRERIRTVPELLERDVFELLDIRYFGWAAIREIKNKLAERGLELKRVPGQPEVPHGA